MTLTSAILFLMIVLFGISFFLRGIFRGAIKLIGFAFLVMIILYFAISVNMVPPIENW